MAKKKNIKDVEVEEVKKTKKVKEEEVEEIELDSDEEEIEEIEEEESEEVEEEKATKKEEKKHKDKKEGYFTQVRREMRKVVWPTLGDVFKYSLAVVLFCIVLCLFFIAIDGLASLLKGLF